MEKRKSIFSVQSAVIHDLALLRLRSQRLKLYFDDFHFSIES